MFVTYMQISCLGFRRLSVKYCNSNALLLFFRVPVFSNSMNYRLFKGFKDFMSITVSNWLGKLATIEIPVVKDQIYFKGSALGLDWLLFAALYSHIYTYTLKYTKAHTVVLKIRGGGRLCRLLDTNEQWALPVCSSNWYRKTLDSFEQVFSRHLLNFTALLPIFFNIFFLVNYNQFCYIFKANISYFTFLFE